jgi:hypothetical protein
MMPLEQRMELVLRVAEGLALHVVDGVLPAEHEDEEELREPPRQLHDAARAHHGLPRELRHRAVARPSGELLEHQRVLRLLDHLVVHVPQLG